MTSMLLISRTLSVGCSVMCGRLFGRRSKCDPVRGGQHLLRLHVRLVDAAHGNRIALDGDGHADQSARVEVLDGIERGRSEEHTSELQSRPHLVCRLLLEKKKNETHQTCLSYPTTTQQTTAGPPCSTAALNADLDIRD